MFEGLRTSEVRTFEARSVCFEVLRFVVAERLDCLVVPAWLELGLKLFLLLDFWYPPLMLDRFEVLAREVLDGLDDGLAAVLPAGREVFCMEERDIEPREALWPIRWASNWSGAKNKSNIAGTAILDSKTEMRFMEVVF